LRPVEVDETYCGGKEKNAQRGRSTLKKTPVLAAIQRDGKARAQVIGSVSAKNLIRVLKKHIDVEATVMTDDFLSYRHLDEVFYQHEAVVHS
jgi:transposase-like protein